MPRSENEALPEVPSTTEPKSESTGWLTPSEAARYLRVKERTILLWARQGKVKGHWLSGLKRRVWRFRLADLDKALGESSVIPSQSPSVRPAERME